MIPQYADIELANGVTIERLRITLAAKLAFERTSRARKWKSDEQPFTTTAYLAWAAARAAGEPVPDDWEAFIAGVVDVAMYTDDGRQDELDSVLPDPTPTAATTG